MEALIPLVGDVVGSLNLTIPRAVAFLRYVGNQNNYPFQLVECRRIAGCEGIVVRVQADVPQRPKFDIQYDEPLLILFDAQEEVVPEVFALRTDFPQVPHLNLRRDAVPKSLCLFAERPEDVLLQWTPALLGERILWWLTGTAYGTLHALDQSLEPFIGGEIRPLIIPPDLFSGGPEEVLGVYEVNSGQNGTFFVAERPERLTGAAAGQTLTLLAYQLPAQEHGIIRLEPQTLGQLHALCVDAGFDLLHALRQTLYQKRGQINSDSASTVLLLAIPKMRSTGEQAETSDLYGFRCAVPGPDLLGDIGPGQLAEALGVLGRSGTQYVPLISPDKDSRRAEAISVQMLLPRRALTPGMAAAFSGREPNEGVAITAVGLGALGSQLFANLAKQGYGRWKLIDEDYLLPHNLVHHAIFGRAVGLPKSTEMAKRANDLFSAPPIAHGIVANLLAPAGKAAEVAEALGSASVVLDMSASVAVSRHLALDAASPAKRVAAFLSPSGRDLVVMSEGEGRAVPMDVLEVQYLRAVLNQDSLEGHLAGSDQAVRYGGSCRDLSSRIAPEQVALHAGIGAAAVRAAAEGHSPAVSIWRYRPEEITLERTDVSVNPPISLTAEGWTVVTDEGLKVKLMALREAKLPKETCGVLLGYIDTRHKRLYVVDALPAPADSEEDEDGCLRGTQGLQEAVALASSKTLAQIAYIGEWHSHPNGAACSPSLRDLTQMEWVREKMHPEGKPALIVIVCERQALSLLLNEP